MTFDTSSSRSVQTANTPLNVPNVLFFKFYIDEHVRYEEDLKNCNSSLDPCFRMDHALSFVKNSTMKQVEPTGAAPLVRIQFHLMSNLSSSYYCGNSIIENSDDNFTYEVQVFPYYSVDSFRTTNIHCQGTVLLKHNPQIVKMTFKNLTLHDTFIRMEFTPDIINKGLCEIDSCTLIGSQEYSSYIMINTQGVTIRIINSQLSFIECSAFQGVILFENSFITSSFIDVKDATSISFSECTLTRSSVQSTETLMIQAQDCTFNNIPEFLVEKFNFMTIHGCSLTNTRITASFGESAVIQFSRATSSSSLFTVKGVVSVTIQYNEIYDNFMPLDTDSRAIFDIVLSDFVYVYRTNIRGSSKKAIYIDEANSIFVRESNFVNNQGGIFINKVVRFSSGLDRNVVKIWNCQFVNNTHSGDGGAVNIPKADGIEIFDSIFLNNVARNGGAIFMSHGFGEISNCTFSNNVALSRDSIGTTGNGGAVYLNDMYEINIHSSNFIQNQATKGGAIFMLKKKDLLFLALQFNLDCVDNTAIYFGHCFYSDQSVDLFGYLNFNKIRGAEVGNYQISTSFTSITGWSFNNAQQTRESKIYLFPGQVISISFGIVDYFGQNISRLQQQPILSADDDDMILPTVDFSKNNNSVERLYFEIRDASVKYFNFSISFPGTSMSAPTFEVHVQDCPPGFYLSTISSASRRHICQKDLPWPVIIPLIVLGSLLVFSFGIFIGIVVLYFGWRIVTRLRQLNQREKAEKKLEKKLLDKKFIFSGDHIELSNSDLQTKLLDDSMMDSTGSINKKDKKLAKKDTFIIPIDTIDVIKKIGEGANGKCIESTGHRVDDFTQQIMFHIVYTGIVYLGKWSGTEVALKSLKFDSNDDSSQDNEEFETEAALLSDLRHPSIVLLWSCHE